MRGPEVEEEQVGIQPHADLADPECALALQLAGGSVVLGPQRVLRHVDRTGLEADELGTLVGHDLEDHAVEIRQGGAAVVAPPVVWIPLEREPLSGLVADDPERPHADNLGRRRGHRPRLREPTGSEGRFEPMPRQDPQVVEQADAGTERPR